MSLRTAGNHHIGTTAPQEDPVDVGHLWTDTTAVLLKRCTAVSPYTWVSTEGGGGGGAPSDAQYLALATNATLTAERVLTPQNGLSGVDNGAGSTYTLEPSYGATANTVCEGDDTRLSDARTPLAHATSHKLGGSDAIRLDEFALPTAAVNFNDQQATSFRVENRTSDPGTPTTGQIWLRTDL